MIRFLDCVTVYRVEKNGLGPYCGSFPIVGHGVSEWTTRTHSFETGCPGPYDDGLNKHLESRLGNDPYHVFGFISLEQFAKWFNSKELYNLTDLGFRLSVYHASNVITSDFQCIFFKHEAVLEKECNLI